MQCELTKAAQKVQEALEALEQNAAHSERVQINLFDLHGDGALISKGSGDKMRLRKIYQKLYDKTGAADWKITDISPAKANIVGHTNKVIGFWRAMAEMKQPGAKIEAERIIGELWDACDGIAATQLCRPEMPGEHCIIITEDNIGIGSKALEMHTAGCTHINVVENKGYMFDEHRRPDPETRLGWRYLVFDAADLTKVVGADGAAMFVTDGDEVTTVVGGVKCPVIDWSVPIPYGQITCCGIHGPEALEPGAPEAEALATALGCMSSQLVFSNAGAVQMSESRRVSYPRRSWAHGGAAQARRIEA